MPSKCCPSQAFKYSRVLWKVSAEWLEEAPREPQLDGGTAEVPGSSQKNMFSALAYMLLVSVAAAELRPIPTKMVVAVFKGGCVLIKLYL